MRERAITTSIIWIALAASIDRILASLTYVGPTDQIMLVPEQWQLGAAILIFVLIIAAAGASVAIWQNATQKSDPQTAAQAEKAKRDTRDRDASIKRLLATMDDEQFDALERGRDGDDGERRSLEALLRRRD